jgi:hypothetical protein
MVVQDIIDSSVIDGSEDIGIGITSYLLFDKIILQKLSSI